MTAFSNDVYIAGLAYRWNVTLGVNAERRGRIGRIVYSVQPEFAEGDLLRSLELPYKLSRDEPTGVRNRARSGLCRGFGYG